MTASSDAGTGSDVLSDPAGAQWVSSTGGRGVRASERAGCGAGGEWDVSCKTALLLGVELGVGVDVVVGNVSSLQGGVVWSVVRSVG